MRVPKCIINFYCFLLNKNFKQMNKKFKILITDDVHPSLIEGLKINNISFLYKPEINRDETLKMIGSFDGIVINTKTRMDIAMFGEAKKLKLIIRLGSGLDIVDLEMANKKNIAVYNTPEGNANAVGEHALTMLLSLFNKICKANTEVKTMQWNGRKTGVLNWTEKLLVLSVLAIRARHLQKS